MQVDGVWHKAPPLPNSFTINFGDTAQVSKSLHQGMQGSSQTQTVQHRSFAALLLQLLCLQCPYLACCVLLQILSNDIYKAANHRVVAPKGGRARYSAPVFFSPSVDAVLEPLPEFVTPDRPAAYRPVPWAEFMGLRVAGRGLAGMRAVPMCAVPMHGVASA